MPEQPSQQSSAALEPNLTAFDKRVLRALAPWPATYDDPMELKNAWQVAEKLREYDVATVRGTLRGLERFHYAWSTGWGHGQRWIATWRAPEVLSS